MAEQEDSTQTNSHIFIVEDSRLIAARLRRTLIELGYNVSDTAASGEDALQKVSKQPPDLVLMDIHLAGEMDGVETAGRIRDRFGLPVIYLTTDASDVALQRAKLTVPYSYLIKPVQTQELYAAIEMALYRHTLEIERREAQKVLNRWHDHLEEQVQARTAELWQANEKLVQEIAERELAEKARQKLEDKLDRAQRMESLGVLAGGVAHDLNNILGPLVAYPDLILMDLPPDSPVREDILQIQKAAKRAAAIVQDLLTLARRGVYQMAPLNLNAVVKQYLNSPTCIELKRRNPNVLVNVNLAPDLLNILGSAPHLSKVIMNLVTNAFEAMPYGGTLTINTSCKSLDYPIAGYVADKGQLYIEAGDYVVLHVGDTGIGIEENDLDKIFEPFYTKKKMGRSGSGLGLAIVHGVIHDHKGRIDLHTEVGRGTEFIIYFPVTRESIIQIKDSDASRGNETVLVVDDLKDQRELLIRLLTSLGYKVTTAENGRAAIAYLGKKSADILILDMIMENDFDGLDTYREIVKLYPGQKAIIASGFSETTRVKEAQKLGAGLFVKKPYTLNSIGKAIRQELDKDQV